MATLYLDRSGLELREDGESLAVYQDGERRRSVPLLLLQRVVIQGNVRLSSRLLARLAGRDVGLVLIERRQGAARVSATWLGGGDAGRRLAQYRAYHDESWRQGWSRHIAVHKLAFQRRLLLQAADERPAQRHGLLSAAATLAELTARLRTSEPVERATVMGIEGAGAAAYFGAYASLFAPSLRFQDRNRRPPRDPVNACLSLAYTLAHYQACCAAAGAGLDPFVGFYHDIAYGRESLACDLVEPVRPQVDGWVWRLFRRRRLRLEHFRRHAGACLLGKAGRALFYEEFEALSADCARRLRRACRSLVRVLTGQDSGRQIGDEAALS